MAAETEEGLRSTLEALPLSRLAADEAEQRRGVLLRLLERNDWCASCHPPLRC